MHVPAKRSHTLQHHLTPSASHRQLWFAPLSLPWDSTVFCRASFTCFGWCHPGSRPVDDPLRLSAGRAPEPSQDLAFSVVPRLDSGDSTSGACHQRVSEEPLLRHRRTRLAHLTHRLRFVMLTHQNTFDWLDFNLTIESDCSTKTESSSSRCLDTLFTDPEDPARHA